jgi:PIN domain nuclease of toxin-antitoxin system
MNYLIDTHILLWMLFEPERLCEKIIAILEDKRNRISIASISFFEIALKYRLGKLELQGVFPDELPDLCREMEIEIVSIEPETLASFHRLPIMGGHRDPFDRMLIWHAIRSGDILISFDGHFESYRKEGLKVIACD